MNWNEYEKMLLQQIADAKHNMEHSEKEYKQNKAKYDALILQHQSFKLAINKMLGDE
jgi:hypothetical protein